MIWIEVQWRSLGPEFHANEEEWASVSPVLELPGQAQSIEIVNLPVGQYEIRARRFNDQTGEASEWAYGEVVTLGAGEVEALPPPVNLRITCNDLVFENGPGRRDIRGYEIRSIPGDETHWPEAVPAHEGIWPASPFPLCTVPHGERTFLVRAVDFQGNVSEVESLHVTAAVLGPLDDQEAELIEDQDEHTTWAGDLVGGSISAGKIVADTTSLIFDNDGPFCPGADSDPFWGDIGKEMVYTTTFTPSSTPAVGEVLTAALTTTGLRWRLEILPNGWDGDTFLSPDGDPFMEPDHEEAFPGDIPVPWPGRVTNLLDQAYRIRLVMPAQYPVAEVSALTFSLSRPPAAVTHIDDPSGGATVDTEARTAVGLIIDALEAHGISLP